MIAKKHRLLIIALSLSTLAVVLSPGCKGSGRNEQPNNARKATEESAVTEEPSGVGTEEEPISARYYEYYVSGDVVGEEKDQFFFGEGRYEPGKFVCEVTRDHEGKQTLTKYEYETTSSMDENLGVKPYSDFKKILGDDLELGVHLRFDFSAKECPVFEPEVAGLVNKLVGVTFNLNPGDRIQAIIPSLGEERKDVEIIVAPLEGYGRGFRIHPEGIEIYVLVNPETVSLESLLVPSENLEIYHMSVLGEGRSSSYYLTLAFYYYEAKSYEEASKNAEEVLKRAPEDENAQWILRECNKALGGS